jgi:hypothetical protein
MDRWFAAGGRSTSGSTACGRGDSETPGPRAAWGNREPQECDLGMARSRVAARGLVRQGGGDAVLARGLHGARATSRRARSRSGVNQFWLLVFDQVYLNIFQLKCTK